MTNISVKAFLSYLSTIAETADSTDDEIIAHRFLIYLGLFMSVGGIVWGTISLVSGLVFQSFIPFGYALITAVNFMYLYHSKNFKRSQNIQVMISLLLPMMCQISLGE